MEYIKLDDEWYSTLEEIQRGGLVNFTSLGSDNNKRIWSLIKEGKVIDGYDENLGYIVKPMQDALGGLYHPENRLCYTFEQPSDDFQSHLKKKLLVLFSPLPAIGHVLAVKRMFTNVWNDMRKHLAPNTYILRIGDSNLMVGSWFMNTKNFSDYERRVQKLIKDTALEYEISQENIVLYGESRGGVGALLHAILGKYPVVAYDPGFDLELCGFREKSRYDTTLAGDMIPDSFIPYFNYLLTKSKKEDSWKRKILTCSKIKTNFPAIQQLTQDKVDVKDVNFFVSEDDEGMVEAHSTFIANNYPLVLSYLNKFLYSCDIN